MPRTMPRPGAKTRKRGNRLRRTVVRKERAPTTHAAARTHKDQRKDQNLYGQSTFISQCPEQISIEGCFTISPPVPSLFPVPLRYPRWPALSLGKIERQLYAFRPSDFIKPDRVRGSVCTKYLLTLFPVVVYRLLCGE